MPFAVTIPRGHYAWSRFFHRTRAVWARLGNWETRLVADALEDARVERPIYVCSLPRAGTTILTELLNSHEQVTSHRYADYPNCWTPYWRNTLVQMQGQRRERAVERAHADRIAVTRQSPEAVEEVLWRYFFKDDACLRILDEQVSNPAFERFYVDNIRKLTVVRGARRYLAKGNYNFARMRYLLTLFPQARFVIPLREPSAHIASLIKQHRLFCEAAKGDSRIPDMLSMSGHDEFGPARRVIDFSNPILTQAVCEAWDNDQEVLGWALYWRAAYEHLLTQLENDVLIADAVCLVSYSQLCAQPEAQIDRILKACALPEQGLGDHRAAYAQRLSQPAYYSAQFSSSEYALIEQHCDAIYTRLGAYSQR